MTAVNVTDDTDGVLCLLLPSYCGEAMCYYVPKQVYAAKFNRPQSLYHIVKPFTYLSETVVLLWNTVSHC